MAGMSVFITSPTQNATIGRSLQISGSVGVFNGAINLIQLQFGADGSIVTVKTPPLHSFTWGWQGLVPNSIRPGQSFQLIVKTAGTMVTKPGPEPVIEHVTGQASMNVVLEHVVPAPPIAPFRSPIVVTTVPYEFTLQGSALEVNIAPTGTTSEVHSNLYGIPQITYQIGSDPLTTVPSSNGRWSVNLSLQPGDYPITVHASDQFESVTTVQQTLTVLLFQIPAGSDSATKKTFSGIPTTASITSWTRLEPQCSNADIGVSSNARFFDPLWLMTRQWQVGEFQAEDSGSPVQARVRATNAALTHCYFGELSADTAAPIYDPMHAPLEALVERRSMRAADADDLRMLAFAVDAGLQFLRMLELDATGKQYRPAFRAKYTLQPLPPTPTASADDATLRFVQTMAGRAPDARLLVAAFRHPTTPQIVFDSSLNIAAADVAVVQQIATSWLAWYDELFTEPTSQTDDAWNPPRLEYAVSVSTRLSAQPEDTITFSASEFDGGRLDWSSFDVNEMFQLDTTGDHAIVALHETTVPSSVTFRGAPAPRFWEMEDANIAYGLLSVGPTDLAHLLMIEYASSYGNDWYVVPLTIPVGTVTRVDSLVVTDTFGVRNLLRPLGDPTLSKPYFSMWQSATMHNAGNPLGWPVPNMLLLPPTIGRSIDGAVLEDVICMRDEMANLAWGIEHSIESAIEMPLYLANNSASITITPSSSAPITADSVPRYLLATTVPDNWIPLLPVELDDHGTLVSRLKRGAVLQPDGTSKVHHAQSAALNALGNLLLYDEEIPREGVHLTRRRRMTRWIDGSTWVWTAFRNEVGRGEGSAGLSFDQLLENEVQPQAET